MQPRGLLPMLGLLMVVANCGGSPESTFPTGTTDSGANDGSATDGATDLGAATDGEDVSGPIDATATPDVQGFDVQPVDTGVTPPVDSGPVDTGTSSGGVCPASCAVSTDCDPCWHAGEARMGNNYCCVSGLCIFRTGTCDTVPPPTDGGTGTGGDGGGPGLDAGGGGPSPDASLGAG